MIKNRPAALLANASYRRLPKWPYSVDWTSIPELIRISMLDLGGIQPITKGMGDVAGGILRDKPSDGEVELFRKRGTTFQLISVVLSCIASREIGDTHEVRPFSVTLIPASKRGVVQHCSIDLVAALDLVNAQQEQSIYTGFDPFTGEWGLYGTSPVLLETKRNGFLDEIGVVVDQFFLQTQVSEDDEVLMMDLRMPSDKMRDRYERHRRKLLFAPFKRVEARRVWGAQTPIELFLVQALAMEACFRSCRC